MAIIWRVDLYSRARVKVAEVDTYTSASLSQIVNSPGDFTLPLWFNDRKVALIETYGIMEFWRRDASLGLPWYLEKPCLIYGKDLTTAANGYEQYVCTGQGLLAMLDRTIDYPSGSAQVRKSGPGDVVMCEYVNENAGSLATVANGRRANGVIPALNIQAPLATAPNWEGSRASKRLMDVLQEIANKCGVDFDIVPVTNPTTGAYEFEFRTYVGQRGIDRSNTSIDPASGLNPSGHSPIIFSPQLGNMAFPEYHLDHAGEINRVTVLGPGTGAARQYDVVESIVYAGDGLDIHEASRDARNEPLSQARIDIGNAILAQRMAKESFDFETIQLAGCAYGLVSPPTLDQGRFYHWGDRVTARAYSIERIKRIIGARLKVAPSSGGPLETINLELLDVPQ